jgi:hypothetical protein
VASERSDLFVNDSAPSQVATPGTKRRTVAWFTRRNYAQHRAMDPAGLPSTFDEWLAHVAQQCRQKDPVLRVVIDPAQFSAWCRAASRDADALARTAFAQVAAKTATRRDWWRRSPAIHRW